jgi:enterochelin esterase family protein
MQTRALLARAQAEGSPLIDGETATFVWQGEQAPRLAGDFNGWDRANAIHFQRAGSNLWTAHLTPPTDAYVEYALFMSEQDDDRTPDPFNKRRIANGMGQFNNWFTMPAAPVNTLTRRMRGVPRGEVTRHALKHPLFARGSRPLYLYEPPNTSEPYPLIVIYDGVDYFRRAHLTTIVDNLIAQKRIRPVGLAMIENGKPIRLLEYMANDLTLLMLTDVLLPYVRYELNLTDYHQNHGAYGVIGASMGGLMSLYTGLRLPHIFGHVITQSGAFHFEMDGREQAIFDLVRFGDKQPIKIWQDVGTMEWLLEPNRKMNRLLLSEGYDVSYLEYNAGHNYTAWSNAVWRGLERLFPLK